MKKSIKVLLTISIILAVVGVVLCVAGISMGFGYAQFREMAEDGTFNIGPDEIYSQDRADGAEGNWQTEEASWSKDEIANLEIEYGFGTLLIEPSEDDDIHVFTEYRSGLEELPRSIHLEKDGDTLKIEDTVADSFLKLSQYSSSDAALTIQIPEGMAFEEISLETGAALVLLETELVAEEIKLIIGAGELTQENNAYGAVQANELTLEIGAGSMELTGVEAKNLDLDCGAGEMQLGNVVADYADVDCGIGQVTMDVAGKSQDYNYEVDCGIGSVVVGDDSYSGLGQSKKIQNGGSKRMDIDCGIGEVNISFAE